MFTSIEPTHDMRGIHTAKHLCGQMFPTTMWLQRGWWSATRHKQITLYSLETNFGVPKQRVKERRIQAVKEAFLSHCFWVLIQVLIFHKRAKKHTIVPKRPCSYDIQQETGRMMEIGRICKSYSKVELLRKWLNQNVPTYVNKSHDYKREIKSIEGDCLFPLWSFLKACCILLC